jgi:hypothetical protein
MPSGLPICIEIENSRLSRGNIKHVSISTLHLLEFGGRLITDFEA